MVVRATSASLAHLNAHSIVPIYLFLNKTRTYVGIYFFNFMDEKWWLAVRQLLSISLESSILFLPTSFYGLSFHKIFWACSVSNHSTQKLACIPLGRQRRINPEGRRKNPNCGWLYTMSNFQSKQVLQIKLQFYNNHLCQPAQMGQSNISKGDSDCEYRVLVSNLLYSS